MQWYNGILLLASFFSCRLLWGTYQSIRVYQDVWAGLHFDSANPPYNPLLKDAQTYSSEGIMRYFSGAKVPTWLAVVYLGSNVVLNTLNFYWFGKMIETVRSRFQEPRKGPRTRGEGKSLSSEVGIEGMDGGGEQTSTSDADSDDIIIPIDAKAKGKAKENSSDHAELTYTRAHDANSNSKSIMLEKTEIRNRRLG